MKHPENKRRILNITIKDADKNNSRMYLHSHFLILILEMASKLVVSTNVSKCQSFLYFNFGNG